VLIESRRLLGGADEYHRDIDNRGSCPQRVHQFSAADDNQRCFVFEHNDDDHRCS
jgi:hypothetical protein